MFDLLDDEYMKERAIDIKDVGNRLFKHLLGAPEITLPSDTQPLFRCQGVFAISACHLNPTHVLGIVTLLGGRPLIPPLWHGPGNSTCCWIGDES